MSQLTPCNYCTLERMKREAKKRHSKVIVVHHANGEWAGWVTAYPKDNPMKGRVRFMKLGDHCEC